MKKTAPTIETVRADIAALQAERDALETAPLSHDAVRAAMLSAFDRAGSEYAAGIPRMLAYPDRAGGIKLHAPLRQSPASAAELTGLLAVVLGSDALAAALDRFVLALPDGPAAAERSARLAAIAEELDGLEHVEEDLIEASGETIARRGDADPRIVLRVRAES